MTIQVRQYVFPGHLWQEKINQNQSWTDPAIEQVDRLLAVVSR